MNKKNTRIEICANSAQSAFEAEKGGAHRVELCAGIPEGGTTPSYGEIWLTREKLSIQLNVIIRPRGGDFLYTDDELTIMKKDISQARELGVDGVVFGCLTPNGEVDKEACRFLLEEVGSMSTTFHRAFDMCSDTQKSLEDIIELGFDRILTSGCQATAEAGKELIRDLIEQANERIIIMPGCGVQEGNIALLKAYTQAQEFHLSAREEFESSMIFRNSAPSMGGTVSIQEYAHQRTSARRVAQVVEIVNSL